MASTETTNTPGHATTRRLPRVIAAAAAPLAAAALVLAPAPALAHDVLTGSSPEDGATLDAAPEEIVLTFNNTPMASDSASDIIVTGPDGEQYQDGEALGFEDLDVTTGLLPLDQAGEYTIGFRVVSSDGHPIQDTLTFTLTEAAAAAAAPEAGSEGGETEEGPGTGDETAAPAEETPVAADEAAAEADSGASPGTMIVIVGAVAAAVIGIGAVVLLAVLLRSRSRGDQN
ncbi:copper resistance protein CopC [Nocardiopsis sp. EMB25]|uniref:copper resistance CopC family protein n=1 Tax=Nocardiopsis TaxID=2013 RepID=UPI00034BE6F9|nr:MULTISPECIES: copper resistance CopC family protein [Nocardiopsis]MCY9787621.1 copper resistance protein CopC [Nocardiopsis sp. EMB25]